MHVTLLYFAALRDHTRVETEQIALPSEVNDVAGLLAFLDRNPALQGKLGSVRVAVNEEFRSNEHRIQDGDTIALIPPVSGG